MKSAISITGGHRITLAGRTFVDVGESTLEHDVEFLRLLKASGLDDPAIREGETHEAFAWRVLTAIVEARALAPLLACLIIPAELVREPSRGLKRFVEDLVGVAREGRRSGWTREVQQSTAAFINDLEDPDDKQRVYGLVAELLFPFLKAGLASWAASLRSSGPAAAPAVVNDGSVPSAGATSAAGAD